MHRDVVPGSQHINRNTIVEFTRVFNAGAVDQEALLNVLEALLKEPPPGPAPARPSPFGAPDLLASK